MNKQRINIIALATIVMLLVPIFMPLQPVDAALDFKVKKGNFTANAGSGNQAITGVGFQPKALILWTTRQTTEGLTDAYHFSIGYTDGTNEGTVGIASNDNVGTSNSGKVISISDLLRMLSDGAPTVERNADIVSLDADGFTITWSAAGTGVIIHYLALGGNDITNVKVGSFTANTVTGNQDITGVGFQPDFIMFMHDRRASLGTASHSQLGIGFAKSSTERATIVVGGEDGLGTSDTYRWQRTDRVIMSRSTDGDADGEADFVQTQSDGFRINWSDAPANADTHLYLAIKGGNYKIGSDTQATSVTTKATTGIGFKPVGLLLASFDNTAATTRQDNTRFSFGAAHATGDGNEGGTWLGDDDAAGTTVVAQSTFTTKIIRMATEAATGSSSTINSEADLQSFDTDGFTLNWTTADATAREFIYVAFGHGYQVLTETLSVSDNIQPAILFFEVKEGSFTKSTAAAPASQSITGVGFQPKVVIFFWTRQTTEGTASEVQTGYGFTTGSANERAIAIASDDNVATSNTGRSESQTRCIIILSNGTPTVAAEAELTSFNADGFTINWTTNEARADIIHYIALGGSELTNALASSFSAVSGSGAQSVTGVGFKPDFLMFISIDDSGTATSTTGKINVGFASSSASEGSLAVTLEEAQTTADTWVRQRTDNALNELSNSGSDDMLADITSFDSDGFTINKSSADATVIHFLALKGGGYKVGSFNKSTGVAPASQSITGVGFKPNGIILTSMNLVSNTNIVSEGRISFGASDGTTEGATWFHDKDAVAPTDTNQRTSTSKIAVHASQSTLNAEADLTSFDADGFTLNWTTNNAVAEEIVYVAFGPVKNLAESVSTADSRVNAPTKALSDAITLTDNVAKTLGKVITETINLSEALNARISEKLASETLAFVDGLSKTYAKSLSETVSLSDALTTTAQLIRNLNESLALADTNVRAFSRKLDETLALSDAISSRIAVKNLQETLTVSDAVTAKITIKNLEETLGLSDAITAKISIKVLGETLSLSDTLANAVTKSVSETLTLADGVVSSLATVKSLSDTLSLSDSVSRVVTKSLAETLSLADSISAKISVKVLQETLSLSDSISKSIIRNIADTLNILDSVTAGQALSKLLNETISLADVVTTQKGLIKQLSETINLADVLSNVASNIRNLAEMLGLLDTMGHYRILRHSSI